MERRLTPILVLVLIVAACGGDGDTQSSSTSSTTTTVASTTQAPASTTTTDVVTTTEAPSTTAATSSTTTTEAPTPGSPPLVITAVDFAEEWVEITNISEDEYSLEGHFLCNFPNYASIADLGTVAAGESVTVELSRIGARPISGEIGIYTDSDFGNPDAMVTYVEWGTPNHARSTVAVEAGLWTAGDFVDNGQASFRALTTGGSGADYELFFE